MAPADVVVFKAGDGQRTNAARQARFRARQRLERWNAKQADHDARVTEARTRAAKYAAPDALETLAACIAEVAWVSMQCLARDKHFSLSGPYARVMAIQARLEREFNAAVDHLPVVRLLAYVRQVAHRSPVVPPFVVHVKPVGAPHPDHGARHVAALVLIVEPGGASLASIPTWWPRPWN